MAGDDIPVRIEKFLSGRTKGACVFRKQLLLFRDVDTANETRTPVAEHETPLARMVRERGLKKGWVARQMGILPSRLTRLLSGDSAMRLSEAVEAARLLGVPVEDLLPGGGGEE